MTSSDSSSESNPTSGLQTSASIASAVVFPVRLDALSSPELKRLNVHRARAGVLAAVWGILVIAAVFDQLQSSVRTPQDEVRAVVGDTVAVNGFLKPTPETEEQTPEWLQAHLVLGAGLWTLQQLRLQSDLWLGRAQWQAELALDPNLPPGVYTIPVWVQSNVTGTSQTNAEATATQSPRTQVSAVTLRVFETEEARKAADPSILFSALGMMPLVAIVVSVLGFVASSAYLWHVARVRERMLRALGLLEVFRRERLKGSGVPELGPNRDLSAGVTMADQSASTQDAVPTDTTWRLYVSLDDISSRWSPALGLGLYTGEGERLGTVSWEGKSASGVGTALLRWPPSATPLLSRPTGTGQASAAFSGSTLPAELLILWPRL